MKRTGEKGLKNSGKKMSASSLRNESKQKSRGKHTKKKPDVKQSKGEGLKLLNNQLGMNFTKRGRLD
jgi:hypothetical protein